jgi:hypothetical protein
MCSKSAILKIVEVRGKQYIVLVNKMVPPSAISFLEGGEEKSISIENSLV